MPDAGIIVVLNDKNGSVGWPLTRDGTTVFSYDPEHAAGTEYGEVVASSVSNGVQLIYGPPFDVFVRRLQLFEHSLKEVVIASDRVQRVTLDKISELSKAGLIGDDTKLSFST